MPPSSWYEPFPEPPDACDECDGAGRIPLADAAGDVFSWTFCDHCGGTGRQPEFIPIEKEA